MKVVLSGGGTGGHIYPALALAKIIEEKEPEAEFLYIGSFRGVEKQIVPKTNLPFMQLDVQGFSRSLSLTNFKTIYLFLKATAAAKKILKNFQPDVVVGTGGYVSGAVLYAAQQMGIPTVIHEQNSVAGVTNKFLAKNATKIGLGFEAAKDQFPADKTEVIGNPRAQEVANLQSDFSWTSYGLEDDKKTLLIFGGSQGAPAINLATLDAISTFNDRPYQVVLVAGPKRIDNFNRLLQERGLTLGDHIKVLPYIDNMPAVMKKADVLVSRAGATSIAELTALGLPAILVPSPFVTGDHQTKNASALVEAGAALSIKEPDFNGESLVKAADALLLNDQQAEAMKAQSAAVGITDAGDRFYRLIKSVIKD
ncbi:undecaprenyldiphospho-muramoylpentapeptide beta-N-acetylglucosaminyltransferase [Fructobacillus tropaeoli]|uniref:UDP-N-acetylglucosamine--N-acetylmuramyl-(pentapeptide) pyrophosphoryl-undecaprenol N-acetylglucosamine transferase n=1 Tax=Fructobacillus tropaeoli TaxID=709323 RepID=A0A3F3H6F6_9LACO|nr:undecaprenyldiphospho-muramoylpentapeptide beta-N-acetylglucosaminyltransferase [Fructobacillus tropaeoli]CAK1228741.1 UDP-N-acetylglucosamine:LPS N-acetylglucosamine transferase (MurG) [Fructobacillus tropaeoli]CAK1230064.1 UDP-N-acetylglucosamine:LPS N-acetylglucosamine transferase (MurG) [Fructobacillus tropaeoli]CAK1233375.1 UDP-N-acetylglucosamine:LPS N-acetylglucosamine transferase (MurG) [Fructobacillus tropaeoli]CAK1251065.1 UDP-N-acetylglucosamine:LPS N-acetylglucosamine transferase